MHTSWKYFLHKYWLPLMIAVVMNLLVAVNFALHHPAVGYDAEQHMRYAIIIPRHLPTQEETIEFFSPPLPYVLPAVVDKVNLRWQNARGNPLDLETRLRQAGRAGQAGNLLLSLGISVLIWQITSLLRPGSVSLKVSVFALLALLTVYYRTFSQMRGEPYVAFSIVLVTYLLLRILLRLPATGWKDGAALGASLGLLMLSRQWGFFVFPALVLLAVIMWLHAPQNRPALLKVALTSGVVAFAVGGWFYIYLLLTYGQVTAFNMEGKGFRLANQPASFYLSSGLEQMTLFRQPVRPNLDNRLLPLFYADTWGDYWCFFTCIRPGSAPWQENQASIAPYLGRVNAAGILPSLLLLGGFLLGGRALARVLTGKARTPDAWFTAFAFAAVLFSVLGYLWFLISYPGEGSGNTIKATYLIQIFMLLPLLGGLLLEEIRARKAVVYWALLAALALVFAHNLPAMISRYVRFS
jgi:hypothetical protein